MAQTESALTFQTSIITEITKLLEVTPQRFTTSNGDEAAVWPLAPVPPMTERGRRAYVSALQVRFEEDVVAYVEMGAYASAHGFYDDGTTAVLSNVSAQTVIIVAKQLVGDLI